MTSITALVLALAVTAGWAVDGQTDQQAIRRLRAAAATGRADELEPALVDAPKELLDVLGQDAACAGQLDTLRRLVSAGARPSGFGSGALRCLLGRVNDRNFRPSDDVLAEIVRLLIDGRAIASAPAEVKAEILFAAARSCRPAVLSPILGAGVEVNPADPPEGTTPLMIAARCAADLVTPLLERGADLRAQDAWHGTAVAALAGAGLDEATFRRRLAALVPSGALEDRVALGRAAARCDATAMDALVALGAKVSAPDRWGATPLHHAAAREAACTRCVAALLAKGADARAANQNGETPLHLVVGNCRGDGCVESARALVAAGADLAARDREGRTPLDIVLGDDRSMQYGELLGKLEYRTLASLGATASATGTLVEKGRAADAYAPERALDGRLQTAWCVRDPKILDAKEYDGGPDWYGVEPAASIEVRLPRPTRIRALRFYTGISENPAIFQANNRIAAVEVAVARHQPRLAFVQDEMRFHDLPAPADAVESFQIRIYSAFRGAKFPDTCIAEIQVALGEDR